MSKRANQKVFRDSIIEELGQSYDNFLNSISSILIMYELNMDTGSKDFSTKWRNFTASCSMDLLSR